MSIDPAGADYRELFPEAQISVKMNHRVGPGWFITPPRLADFVLHLFGLREGPKFLSLNHIALVQSVQILLFDGLDQSRFERFEQSLPGFTILKENGFPISVRGIKKQRHLKSGIDSMLGIEKSPKKFVRYATFEEMLATTEELFENGFPLKKEIGLEGGGPRRFELFGLRRLGDEDLKDYEELPECVPKSPFVVALDCEMIETSLGEECGRLSVIDADGNTLFDEFLKPIGSVVDLRTGFSGITNDHVERARIPSSDVRRLLSGIASRDTIIIGHSLEYDFRVLKLVHYRVVDTSLVYKDEAIYPHKPSLESLYTRYISERFRVSGCGHDSLEDAKAAFELAWYAMANPIRAARLPPPVPELFSKLKGKVSRIDFVTDPSRAASVGSCDHVLVSEREQGDDLCSDFIRRITEERPPLSIACFGDLARCEIDDSIESEICSRYDRWLARILAHVPPNSVTIVYGGTGNRKRIQGNETRVGRKGQDEATDRSSKAELDLCCRGLAWVICTNGSRVTDASPL
jgi:RNA exonuclease 1